MQQALIFVFILHAAALSSCGSKSRPVVIVMDVTTIAGKPLQTVVEVLGPAVDSARVEVPGAGCHNDSCEQIRFRDGEVEIVFMNGVADWITIYPKQTAPYYRGALKALSLPPKKPNNFRDPGFLIFEPKFSSPFIWTDVAGIKLIYCYSPDGTTVGRFILRTNTTLLNEGPR